jgi:hypothetical protein
MFRYSSFLMVLAIGCQNEPEYIEIPLPKMFISSKNVDFGEVEWGSSSSKEFYVQNQGSLPMGLKSPGIPEEGFESNFQLNYDITNITCTDETEAPNLEDFNIEVGDFVINPGCQITIQATYMPDTIGDAYASIELISFIENTEVDGESTGEPNFYRDPSNFKQSVILHGYSNLGEGNILVTPRIVEFGHHWTGETSTKQVMINNVGDGNLVLESPQLSDDCDEAFSIDLASLDFDGIIPNGDGTLFEVTFDPTDLEPAYCTVIVPSNDQETASVEVTLKGNAGSDPTNEAPVVTLISPLPGYQHASGEDLTFELSLFDKNQPADTLLCKIKSMSLDAGVYDCSAEEESGFVAVSIPRDELERGVDTFLVTVTDQSELQGTASTTVLYGTPFPEGDDDGDGYGNEGELQDCDDNNPNIYPHAAEIADGKDNDCDGGIDEKTTASDDDGDSVSELEGDCDDGDVNSYPGAPEQPDLKDNDCDGIIDEHTSLFDDDGDGFSEVDNDCNDNDPTINPAAIEYCDNIDNNCNNLRDEQEGCISLDSDPYIIGGIQMADRAISVGESTTMTVFVYEGDGEELTFNWEEDSSLSLLGHSAVSSATSQTITWTAPDNISGGSEGQIFSVYVVVEDEDGKQDWIFDEISVYTDPVETNITQVGTVADSGGCGSSSDSTTAETAASLFLPLIGFGFYRRRRRK